ncbi:MAG: hypothetical protein RL459_521 [Pseudomonadota bacterium]|jgi:S1-C subfamily serine protease
MAMPVARWRYRATLCALFLLCSLALAHARSQTTAATANWGTGFVVSEGYVLTAFHVVQGRAALQLGPVGGKWLPAELVQSDAKLDLALLRAPISLPAVALASSGEVPIGLEVSVIGYPLPKFQGLSKKITQGIVNGARSEAQQAQDVGLFQISAEVSRGNSGGPVFAADGSVIGMVQRKIDARKLSEQGEDLVVNVNYALRSSQIIKFLQAGVVIPQVQGLSLVSVLRPYQVFERSQASVLAIVGRDAAAAPSTGTRPAERTPESPRP